jgi:mono/diheme cytochrome c family protein
MRNFAWIAALAVVALGCSEETASPTTPVVAAQPPVAPPPAQPPAQPAAAPGKRLYLTACANCHGPDGTGSMMRQALPTIGDLGSPEMHGRLSDEAIIDIISNGRNNKMPAFGGMFNAEQVQAIVTYVRSMKRAQ